MRDFIIVVVSLAGIAVCAAARLSIAIAPIVLGSITVGASATEAPIRPQQAHAWSVAQVIAPSHGCYCG
jgi:hypothetical protein